MKKYEIKHKETNHKGYIWVDKTFGLTRYYVSWRGGQLEDWKRDIDDFAKEWDIPRSVKFRLLLPEIAAKIAIRTGVIMAIMAKSPQHQTAPTTRLAV